MESANKHYLILVGSIFAISFGIIYFILPAIVKPEVMATEKAKRGRNIFGILALIGIVMFIIGRIKK